eukprot:scaffold41904_cov45-Phaeocystis_antarctica.AAC.1
MTKPSLASKLAEINHPDACPPQWLPVLLASSSSHIDSPAPRFDEEDLPFEALSMERRMTDGPTPMPSPPPSQSSEFNGTKAASLPPPSIPPPSPPTP